MEAWVGWLVAAVALGVAEVLTLTLVLGMLAVAAAAAALVSLGAGAAAQIVTFLVVAVGLLAVARPVARRHLHGPPTLRTGTAALVGRRAVVVEPVDARAGRVKIDGELWSARAFDEAQVIPAGATVDVLEIQGATALVYTTEQP